ncbi:transporter substrate-binding domain-containing protein [Paucibacter sp. AS339]|uniref:substrate-binding periplasmic protein n=1 Tax=Paucibacter hankyongi TaxID=3133434 RepID=UPI0030A02005
MQLSHQAAQSHSYPATLRISARCLVRFLLALSALIGLATQAAPLQIATGELPPYATQSRADQGIALEIVRRAFALSGHEVEYHFLPWPRAQQETKAGHFDASAYWGASAERRRDFLLSDNVLTEQWLIVHRRSVPLQWREIKDLKAYSLGFIRDYTYTPEFWDLIKSGSIKGDATPTDLAGLRKMLLGRMDAMPMERNVACDLLSRHFKPSEAAKLAAYPRALTDSFTTHLILPPQRPRSAGLLADFNRGLKRLKDSGEHAALMKSVSCPMGWKEGP